MVAVDRRVDALSDISSSFLFARVCDLGDSCQVSSLIGRNRKVFGRLKISGYGWVDRLPTLALWRCLLTMLALVEPGLACAI